MRKSARIAAAASGAILLVAANSAAAWADSEDADNPPITVDPTSVAVGDDVTFSGEQCVLEDEDGETEVGEVILFANGEFQDVITPEDDGSWTGTYEALLDGAVVVDATCDFYDDSFDYASAEFQIDAGDDEGETPIPEVLTGEIVDITRDGCEVTLSTDASLADDFRIEVWDDGDLIDTVEWSQEDSGAHDAVWTITQPAKEGAPGVGFVFYGDSDDTLLDSVDPYEYPAEVADNCAGVGDGDDAAAAGGDEMPATGADSHTTALIVAGVMVSAGVAMVAIRRGKVSSNG